MARSAERAMRSIAFGRKNYLFVGSPAGGRAAAVACTPIETAKLNGVDPQTWLADTIARIPDYESPASTTCGLGNSGQTGRFPLLSGR